MIVDNYFSLSTLIFYYIIGLGCAIWIRLTIDDQYKYQKKIMYGVLCFVLTTIAGLRYVSYAGIGGMDASTYEYMFKNPNSDRLTELETIFVLYTQFIALLTSSPIVYRFISYGFIAAGYGYMLYKLCNNRQVSVIPFILIIFPYLRSFNTMRNSLAISVFLIGLVLLFEKKTLWGVIMIISTVFIHRMSILYVSFLPYYYLFKNFNFTTNKRIFLFLAFYATLGYIIALKIQAYMLLIVALSEHDTYYLSSSLNSSILDRIPLIFQHLVMLFALAIWNEKLPNTPLINFLRLLIVFDIIIIPISVVFGMWRSIEYMYIPRLIMWSYLIPTIVRNFSRSSKLMIKSGIFFLFSIWLIFRLNQEWRPAGLMPYQLIFQ